MGKYNLVDFVGMLSHEVFKESSHHAIEYCRIGLSRCNFIEAFSDSLIKSLSAHSSSKLQLVFKLTDQFRYFELLRHALPYVAQEKFFERFADVAANVRA